MAPVARHTAPPTAHRLGIRLPLAARLRRRLANLGADEAEHVGAHRELEGVLWALESASLESVSARSASLE